MTCHFSAYAFAIAIALAMLGGCSGETHEEDFQASDSRVVSNSESEPRIVHKAGFVSTEDDIAPHWAMGMTCAPDQVRAGDVLRMTFDGRHGPEILFRTPEGKSYYYSWLYNDHDESEIRPPVDGAVITKSDIVVVNVNRAAGIKYSNDDEDHGQLQPIFNKQGVYRIMVSDKFETHREDLILDAYCHVDYRP